MLFPTFNFFVFFLITALLLAPLARRQRTRRLVLLVASYAFYAWWNPWFCLLLFGSSLGTFIAGLGIAHSGLRAARWLVGIAVALHLLVLAAFRYADLLIGTANHALHAAGAGSELPFLGLILPVGLSFYTFHGISYVVDVYRGDVAVCRRLEDMLLYLAFFPQLVAGPIVRASFFLPQIYGDTPAHAPLGPAVMLILGGLFKKTILANYLATELVDKVFFDPANFAAPDLLLAMYGYAIQIYCDFSGYTDIAIGLAALLGFRFPPNFNQPYRAASFQEFWRRWHISLSSWLRDYLYKPLGGSRHGPARTAFALSATMLLGGLWHGADWKFVAWGGMHGAALAIERVLRPLAPGWWRGRLARVLGTLVVFHLVCVAWVFFRSDSMDTAVIYLRTLFAGEVGIEQARPATVALILLGLALQFTPPGWAVRTARWLATVPDWASGAVASLLVVAIDAMGPDGVAPFIYFQF